MANVICILQGFQSLTEANALCLSPMIDIWRSNGHRVDVFSIEDQGTQEPDEGMMIIPKQDALKIRMLRQVRKFFQMPLGSRSLAGRAEKKVCRHLSSNTCDAAIAVINPVESAEALTRIKKKFPNLKTIIYEIDPASNRYKTPAGWIEKIWKYRSTAWEIKTYRSADRIIHMKTHQQHFSKPAYDAFREKTLYLDIPSFQLDLLGTTQRKADAPVHMVYAGAFYPVLRNPEKMFDILWEFSKQNPVLVDIYTGNNMQSQIKRMLSGREEVFHLHEYVSKDVLHSAYEDADILLDLGNLDSDFLSSKVLQYIGTGKPILHFSQDSQDVALPYLKQYRNAVVINLEVQNVPEALDFLRALSKKAREPNPVDGKRLLADFYENTPQYSAERIMELF